MKYLKMIVTNPWIVLLIVLIIHSSFRVYDTLFDFSSFTLGLLLASLGYCIIDKLRESILKEQLNKLDAMSRASTVTLLDKKGNEITEDNEEYIRGFREASNIIKEDLK